MDIHTMRARVEAEGVTDSDFFRFYHKIDFRSNGCWIWMGARKKPPGQPYGYFNLGVTRLAHRVSYEWFVDDLTPGLDIDHWCEDPSCVNPDHLEEVTRQENLHRSGGGVAGENSRKTKCPKGHEYSGINSQGRRVCIICQRESTLRSRRNRGVKPRNKVVCGTISQYQYGCRCEDCRAAKRRYR